MGTTHQPEPWDAFHLYGAAQGEGYVIRAERPVKSGRHHGRIDDAGRFTKADAERIVACVNAFERVDTDAIAELPNGKVAGLLELASKFRDQVRDTCKRAEKAEAERAELLEALRSLAETADRMGFVANMSMCDDEIARARALVAKHGGAK